MPHTPPLLRILPVAALLLAPLLAQVLMFGINRNLQAQNPVSPPALSPQSQTAPSQGVAVLNDGRVFSGNISEVAGGYRVATGDGGQIVLPFDQISVTSASLVGAYEAYRASITVPNADIHLSLAEWCIGNGLWAQAYQEVQSALKLEPQRSEAHVMLKRLDAYVQPLTSTPVRTVETGASTPLNTAAISSPTERRVSGTMQSTHVTYMTKVQPILMNSCGNGACHGQISENRFKLHNVRLESRNLKLASEANLKILKEWIDFDNPHRSPLLTSTIDGSPQHRDLFAGRRKLQYQLLENWVIQLAQEQKTAPVSSTSVTAVPAPAASPVIQQVSGERMSDKNVTPAAVLAPAASPYPALETARNAPELQQIRRQLKTDAFDPNAFNSMMHGGNLPRNSP